jgi:coenzyme F420-0:L-glutamate ligase/coenzyme F420-1:gamma-L-glutamate ligase
MADPTVSIEMFALQGIPLVKAGDDVGALIVGALEANQCVLRDGDVVVVAQKIVSKAERRIRRASEIVASDEAVAYAGATGKDARKVQAILDESTEVVRVSGLPPEGVIIARHRHGWVCANAGIDESNVGEDGALLLLPENPDESAQRIALRVCASTGVTPGVIVSDTFGRPWRRGLVNVAIGVANVPIVDDWVGRCDAFGRELQVSQQATADELAAAAGLLMGKASLTPVVIVRGLTWQFEASSRATQYVRPSKEDLFK